MPVSIQMTLQFKEVTYLTKEDFDTNSINANIKSNTIGGGDRGTRGGF